MRFNHAGIVSREFSPGKNSVPREPAHKSRGEVGWWSRAAQSRDSSALGSLARSLPRRRCDAYVEISPDFRGVTLSTTWQLSCIDGRSRFGLAYRAARAMPGKHGFCAAPRSTKTGRLGDGTWDPFLSLATNRNRLRARAAGTGSRALAAVARRRSRDHTRIHRDARCRWDRYRNFWVGLAGSDHWRALESGRPRIVEEVGSRLHVRDSVQCRGVSQHVCAF